MAELPKLSSLAESMLLASVASVSFLIGQLMKKINAYGPAPSSTNAANVRKTFQTANHQIWKRIHLLECITTNFVSDEHSKSNATPMLNITTQTAEERAYILNTYNQRLLQVNERWVSGDAYDCWVSSGDIVAQIHPQINNNKVIIYFFFAMNHEDGRI